MFQTPHPGLYLCTAQCCALLEMNQSVLSFLKEEGGKKGSSTERMILLKLREKE